MLCSKLAVLKPSHTSSEASAPPAEAHMARLFPHLDIQESLGADGPSAGLYGKFSWLDVTLSSPSPGRACAVRHLNKIGNTGLSRAVTRNAKVESHGHQGGVSEAT